MIPRAGGGHLVNSECLRRMEKVQSDPEFPEELLELILFSDSRFHELIGQKYWQSGQKHVFPSGFISPYDLPDDIAQGCVSL